MPAPLIPAAAQAAVAATPAVVDFVKKKAPTIVANAQKYFTTSGGGSLSDAASLAQQQNDTNLARAIYESLLNGGARYQLLAKGSPLVSEDDIKAFLGGMRELERREIEATERHHIEGADPRATMRRKAVEIKRACRVLGVSPDELANLIVTFSNITPSDIRAFQEDRVAFAS